MFLSSINLKSLYLRLYSDELCLAYALENHIFLPSPRCCGKGCGMKPHSGKPEGFVWRCSECYKIYNLRQGSLLLGAHISILQLIELTYYFFKFSKHGDEIAHEIEVDVKTVRKYFKQFRQICFEWWLQNAPKIGGPGLTVEVDETVVYKRKYQRGRLVREVWIVGGICRETREFLCAWYLIEGEKR